MKSRLVATAIATLLGALMSPFLATPALATGDDYLYRTDTTQASDPWGFTKRQCVSFAAWELKQRGHPLSNAGNVWGNASHWDDTARARHFVVTTTPKIGAIGQWNGYERSTYYPASGGSGYLQAGYYGHVAVVIRVYADKSVQIEQYNISGNRSYSTMHVRAPRYLYLAG